MNFLRLRTEVAESCIEPGSLSDLGRLTSENRPQRGQFLPDLQALSPAMGQNEVSVKTNLYSSYVATKKGGAREVRRSQKWASAVDLQPTIAKSDRLLGKEWPVGPIQVRSGRLKPLI